MARTSTVSTRIALCLLLLLTGLNVYRARRQSIATDEAMTFTRFVLPPLAQTWQDFDANNHVLNTLATRVSVARLGRSSFTLRLPTLLAGVLYFAAVWRLARRWFGGGLLFLACVALLTVNPLILDYLVACRGYGMALAGWLWGMLLLAEAAESGDRRKMTAGAVAFALAFCANLAFVFPIAAGVLVFAGLETARRGRAALWTVVDRLFLPAVAISFVLLLLPLLHATPANFYYGANLLHGAISELAEVSLYREPNGQPWAYEMLVLWAPRLCAALAVAALWALARALWRKGGRPGDVYLILFGGSATLTLAALVAAHQSLGMLYPLNRTALYWIPTLAALALATAKETGLRWVRIAAGALALAVAARGVTQIRPDRFLEWPEDAQMSYISSRILNETGNIPVRICAPHARAVTLGYYRIHHGVPKWKVVADETNQGPCDWRLQPAAQPLPDGWTVLWGDSDLLLLHPGQGGGFQPPAASPPTR
jgi:hypothetical protein